MGRTSRWFRNLLGMKKEKERGESPKKRWSFTESGRDVGMGSVPSDIPAAEAAWLRSYYSESDKEHSIAVAAATAAAADAAVAAAQAAVAVVRLTSHGRGSLFGNARERWGAVMIQTVFRGYLARKALRALKGLVKLQAYVRGYLVRRQAAATLHSMQALIRAQATVRLHKARAGLIKTQTRPRRSIDHPRSSELVHSRRLSVSDENPKIVEIDTCRPKSDFGEDPYAMPSPLPSQMIPDYWGYECRFSTAQTTPRFMNSNAPLTPAKSARGYSNFPNYMANTQSFRAKVRSQSAPKQRPKRLSLNEMVDARASLSGVRMQKSCSQAQDIINFKNTIMCKFDRPAHQFEGDYLERRW